MKKRLTPEDRLLELIKTSDPFKQREFPKVEPTNNEFHQRGVSGKFWILFVFFLVLGGMTFVQMNQIKTVSDLKTSFSILQKPVGQKSSFSIQNKNKAELPKGSVIKFENKKIKPQPLKKQNEKAKLPEKIEIAQVEPPKEWILGGVLMTKPPSAIITIGSDTFTLEEGDFFRGFQVSKVFKGKAVFTNEKEFFELKI